jgi:penicillin-binding protein-related factor A (putative recombinase)
MDKGYIKYKLQEKFIRHYRNAGLMPPEYDLSSLVENVSELGDYKIIWEKDLPTKVIILDFPHRVEVMSGQYYIYKDNGDFNQQLYSSEFISFDLKEMREYKLNEILKIKI